MLNFDCLYATTIIADQFLWILLRPSRIFLLLIAFAIASVTVRLRQTFRDVSKRAQIRVLELQKERAAIDIERNEYCLRPSVVLTERAGVLDIGDADKLAGRRGERRTAELFCFF